MAMVGVVSGSLYTQTHSYLVLVRRPLGAILHSSNEPGEVSQWLCLDDSTMNIVLDIIIIIILLSSAHRSWFLGRRWCRWFAVGRNLVSEVLGQSAHLVVTSNSDRHVLEHITRLPRRHL